MYDVPLATYEDAIEADLAGIDAETVAVDRRGYAPRIAEELGEGYLQNRYIIVDEGQRDADVLDQTAYSFDDQLTAELFQQNEDLLQQALADGPLSVAINIDFQNGAFQVSSLLDDPEIRKTVEEANEFRRNIEALELTDLRDPRELRDRYEQATDLRAELGDIRREFDVALSTVQTDEFSFKHTDATGYVIYADSPLCVLFDGDDVPWDTGSYHATEERNEQLDAVLTSLYEGDKLEVQEEAIIERMKTIAANTLQDDDTAYEQGTVEFYRAVK